MWVSERYNCYAYDCTVICRPTQVFASFLLTLVLPWRQAHLLFVVVQLLVANWVQQGLSSSWASSSLRLSKKCDARNTFCDFWRALCYEWREFAPCIELSPSERLISVYFVYCYYFKYVLRTHTICILYFNGATELIRQTTTTRVQIANTEHHLLIDSSIYCVIFIILLVWLKQFCVTARSAWKAENNSRRLAAWLRLQYYNCRTMT